MRIPTFVQRLVSGRQTIHPSDLLPRRVPHLKHRLAPPAIPPHKAAHYAACLLHLGHSPSTYNLPTGTTTTDTATRYEIDYISPAARRVERELPKRVAKINFIKAQMAKMPDIIKQWREQRRANREAKQKKYPF